VGDRRIYTSNSLTSRNLDCRVALGLQLKTLRKGINLEGGALNQEGLKRGYIHGSAVLFIIYSERYLLYSMLER